jgi:hypothetical protein
MILRMAAARCSVSFTDSDGLSHTAHVQAESLYEAVALAIAEFRDDRMVPSPGPATEFIVAIERPAVEHRIRLSQVARWAENTTKEGPAGIIKRQRVRALLG